MTHKKTYLRKILLTVLILSVVLFSFSACSLDTRKETMKELSGQFPFTDEETKPPVTPTEPDVKEPAAPTEPVVPTEPALPTEPEVPAEPSVPTEPEVPTEPAIQVPVFKIADGANTLKTYSKRFVVGTNGGIRLGTLFASIDGTSTDITEDIIMELTTDGKSAQPLAIWRVGAENWADWQNKAISLEGISSGNYVLSIRSGEGRTELPVTVLAGLYNVQNAEEWKAVPNGESIALLQDFSVSAYSTQTLESGTGHFAKNIGSGTVYGNMHTIRIPEYLVFAQKKDNYFICVNGGTLQDLLMEGPVYSSIGFYTSNEKGMYVHGVVVNGDSSFTGCYLSGFRAPVRINNGTVTMTDSTFKGGIFANIYVYKAALLRFANVTTVQYAQGSVAGTGIYIEAEAGNVQITADNLTQYNRYTQEELNNYLRAVSGMGSDSDGAFDDLLNPITGSNIKKFDALKYTDGTYHLGILVSNKGTKSGGSWLRPTYSWTDAAISGELPGYVASKQCEVGSILVPEKGRLVAYGTPAFTETMYSVSNPYTAATFLAGR